MLFLGIGERMSELAILFRRNLRNLLRKRGDTSELAKKLGVSPNTISRYLHPDGPVPGIDQLERIAEALHIDALDLLKHEPGFRPTVKVVEHDLAECARRVAEALYKK